MATTEQATQTWWRVSYGEIESFDVVKVTPKTVVYLHRWTDVSRVRERVQERRELREQQGVRWFDNERDAIEYQRSRLAARVVATQETARIAAKKLAAFNAKYPEAISALLSKTNERGNDADS